MFERGAVGHAEMTEQQLLDALGQGEAFDWEFKSAQGGVPGSLWETYSAMANNLGGMIVLGVDERDGVFRVTGLPDPGRMQKSVWDILHNRGKISVNLCRDEDVSRVHLGAAEVLTIRVRQASRQERPVYVGQNPLDGTYQRRHEGDYKCSSAEVGRMLADQSVTPPDSRILSGFGLDDLHAATLEQYRNRFSARSPQHPWLELNTQELLIRLGGWRQDRETQQDGLTVAGLLMFGKEEAIRDAHGLPQFHVDYQEKLSEDPGVRWTDRIYPDGTWAANLFQFYHRTYTRLISDLKVPFQLQPDMFRKDETIVHEALREALVNALIHADYGGVGGVRIVRKKQEIELRNPGALLVSLEQLARGGVSECRNRSLQCMFQMIGAGEKAGSGVDKILAGWRSQQWLLPEVIPAFGPDTVTWRLPFASLLPTDSVRRLADLYGQDLDGLDSHERLALVIADVEGGVTNVRMQFVSDLHPADLSKRLRGLVARGLLVATGRTSATVYSLSKSGRAPTAALDSSQIAGDSSQIAGDSSQIAGDSSQIAGDSSHITIHPLDEKQIESLRRKIYPQGWRRKFARSVQVKDAILLICSGRFATAAEIAAIMGRNPNNLRSRYLAPMVRDGSLRLLYPRDLNRPDQAYSAETVSEDGQ